MSHYHVGHLKVNSIKVRVPGSKSITNRALLIAALSNGSSLLKGTLRSDDSVHFLNSLISLGFNIEENEAGIRVEGLGGNIPVKEGTIDVGSAGTAARFLTSMLALSDGVYTINASEQMQKRPMRDLLEALEKLGAKFEYLNENYSLPLIVTGLKHESLNYQKSDEYCIDINIDKSSQYLSALLMTGPMLDAKVIINLTGSRKARSYVGITMKMMEDFGGITSQPDEDLYIIERCIYTAREYTCEPDVSAACYYYAMAAITGCQAVVYDIFRDSMQGDIRFLDILEMMGCSIYDTPEGVAVKGNEILKGISVNMSDCSDQTMTLAAIAPYASSPVSISGVGHIRRQESDRLFAVADALERMNIHCIEKADGIEIIPGKPAPASIDTFEDHRMAMAFAVTGLMCKGIVINNPECCKKTFPDYFKILDSLTDIY